VTVAEALEHDTPAAATPGRRTSRRLGAFAWTAIVALIALAGSIVALVFDLWPSLKPDPRTTLGAQLSVFTVEPDVSYGDYLSRISFSDPKLHDRLLRNYCGPSRTCGGLSLPGQEIYVRMTVEGFKRRSVLMLAAVYDAASQTPVQGAGLSPVSQEVLDSPSDSAVVPVWTPCPINRTGRIFVRIELYHKGDEVLLAVADSQRFRPVCRLPGSP
jgi:hypothetical protein